jgi:hypothetical protein
MCVHVPKLNKLLTLNNNSPYGDEDVYPAEQTVRDLRRPPDIGQIMLRVLMSLCQFVLDEVVFGRDKHVPRYQRAKPVYHQDYVDQAPFVLGWG